MDRAPEERLAALAVVNNQTPEKYGDMMLPLLYHGLNCPQGMVKYHFDTTHSGHAASKHCKEAVSLVVMAHACVVIVSRAVLRFAGSCASCDLQASRNRLQALLCGLGSRVHEMHLYLPLACKCFVYYCLVAHPELPVFGSHTPMSSEIKDDVRRLLMAGCVIT